MGIREELKEFAVLQASIRDKRAELVDRARQSGMTWREISIILDMTQAGLIKAQKVWLERREKP